MDKDIKELKEGLGKDKVKPNWLEEVKQDAYYNYYKRLKEQQEKEAFEEAKAKGNVDQLLESLKPKKGK